MIQLIDIPLEALLVELDLIFELLMVVERRLDQIFEIDGNLLFIVLSDIFPLRHIELLLVYLDFLFEK